MIFVYDILLNFNKKIYEFFEWREKDNIKYVRKIPIIKVSSKFIDDLTHKDILFHDSFLSKIFDKTIFYNEKMKDKYICLVSDGNIVFGILLENNKLKYISRLLLDEEEEILSIVDNMPKTIIDYKILGQKKYSIFSDNRGEEEIKKVILKEVEELYRENKIDKLNYYFYEYTLTTSSNKEYVYEKLRSIESDEINDKILSIYKTIKLSYQNKY